MVSLISRIISGFTVINPQREDVILLSEIKIDLLNFTPYFSHLTVTAKALGELLQIVIVKTFHIKVDLLIIEILQVLRQELTLSKGADLFIIKLFVINIQFF